MKAPTVIVNVTYSYARIDSFEKFHTKNNLKQ